MRLDMMEINYTKTGLSIVIYQLHTVSVMI